MVKNEDSKAKAQIIIAAISGLVAVIVAVISTMATIYTKDSSLKESITKIDNLDAKTQQIESTLAQEMPVGSITPFAGKFNQAVLDKLEHFGWLPCAGGLVSKDKFPELYNAIGTTFGQSDQLGWFRLPDLSGRVVMGAGQGQDLSERTIGQIMGKEQHAINVSELPDHSHPYIDFHYYDQYGKKDKGYDKRAATPEGDETGGLKKVERSTLVNQNKKAEKFSLIQPSIVLNFIIKCR